jgi:hypothetical protein
MKQSETKLIIIQNYINYFTSNDDERKLMYENAYQYVKEDHVDELENLTKQYEIYYIIRCDDPKRPNTILPDKYFELYDVYGLQNYLEICNAHKLNYDLVIEEFDKNNEEVTENIYLINKNHLND